MELSNCPQLNSLLEQANLLGQVKNRACQVLGLNPSSVTD